MLNRSVVKVLCSPRTSSRYSVAPNHSSPSTHSKPLTLFIGNPPLSPNGQKASIMVEEMKAAYPGVVDYDVRRIDIMKNEQKEGWYTQINPNGRIPALIHHREDGSDFNIFESAGIILYLVQQFDRDLRLSFEVGSDDQNEALQWILFAHGGLTPMMAEALYYRSVKEKVPPAIQRYAQETKRLFSVFERRLTGREYLVGPGKGSYSIADINAWPWVKSYLWSGLSKTGMEKDYPNLNEWMERIRARPAVQSGVRVGSLRKP